MNRLLRRREVEQMVSLSRASIYRLADSGDFPHPIRVGPRAVRWPLREIEAVDVGTPSRNRQG